jgi:hypothetical protein
LDGLFRRHPRDVAAEAAALDTHQLPGASERVAESVGEHDLVGERIRQVRRLLVRPRRSHSDTQR